MEEFKPVVFKLGTQKYGVDISKVQGIEKEQKIVPVPNASECIKGIINLRGEVIPVYSLKRKFNMPEVVSDDPQYIIVMIKDSLMAIEVDGVEEIHNVEDEMLHDVPAIVNGIDVKYLKKVIRSKDDLIIVVEIDELLSDKEYEKMDKMVKNQ